MNSSAPKAFLCSQDGTTNYPIVKKITTIGSANCDITIDTTDEQHALIEYIDDENCFILQDLNSVSGSFVNECRIQNAAVKLVEQDSIRFGLEGQIFQFIVQSQFKTIPAINLNGSSHIRQSQTVSSPPLQIITQTVPSRALIASINSQQPGGATSFWLSPLPSGSLITINNQTQSESIKPPQGVRSRPISAGPNGCQVSRRFSKETKTSLGSSKMNVWAKGVATNGTASATSYEINATDTYRLSEEKEETSRLSLLEREVKAKSKEIRELREKLAFFQSQTSVKSSQTTQISTELEQIKRDKSVAVGMVNKLQKDLTAKEASISRMSREIESLKRQMKELGTLAGGEEAAGHEATIAKLVREIETLKRELRESELKLKSVLAEKQDRSDWQRIEHDELAKEKAVAVGLVNQMQKDLGNKETVINKMAREIESLKRDLKESNNSRKELEERLSVVSDKSRADDEQAQKDKELVVIRSKFKATEQKVLDLTNQVTALKNELDESQKQYEKQSKGEKKLRDELEHAKMQFLDMQSAERIVRIDLEQVKRSYESFRSMIVQSIYSTPGVGMPATGDLTNDDITAKWKEITRERNNLYETIESLKKNIANQEKTTLDIDAAIKAFESQIEAIETVLSNEGRRSEKIETQLTSLKNLEVAGILCRLRELIVNSYSNEICWQAEIESSLLSLFSIDINNSEPIVSLLGQIKSQVDVILEEKSAFEAKIIDLEQSIETRVSQAVESQSSEVGAKISDAEARKDEFYKTEIEKIEARHSEFVELVKSEFTAKIDQLAAEKDSFSEQIESLNQTIVQLNVDIETKVTESNQALALLRTEYEASEGEYKLKIEQYSAQIEEFSAKIQELTTSMSTSEENYSKELNLFKEQVRQHSLTIVELEKELSSWRGKESEYIEIIESLKKRKESVQTHIVPAIHSVKLVDNSLEVESMGRTIDLLRGECQTYKIRLSEQDELIKTLRRDLMTASAKMTDVQGAMSEKQKRELEKNKQLVIDQQKELSDARSQMAKLSEIVDKQTKQIESLSIELDKSKSLVDKYRHTSEENGLLSIELKSKLDHMESQLKKFDCVKKEEGKITNELTALGAQCKGERHEQVISRQREALNELRQKVKQLESTRPQLPAQQQQMQQQIMLLKKQLAEMRASVALTEDIAKQTQISRGHGDHASLMIEEKTAHYETQTALESSEESFLTMLKTLAAVLDLSEIDGLRSMTGLSFEERSRLFAERAKSIEAICVKIKSLQEKIQRKDELLREYELDLARLRQAEFILQKKSEQLDEIQVFSRTKEEEIDYLKEALKTTKSDLEREKQLNAAIKEKRPLTTITQRTEKIRRGSTDTLHHHCPPGDSKAAVVKKEMSDKIKRKDYELKALKSEIKSKAEEISNLTSRLTIVENSSPK